MTDTPRSTSDAIPRAKPSSSPPSAILFSAVGVINDKDEDQRHYEEGVQQFFDVHLFEFFSFFLFAFLFIYLFIYLFNLFIYLFLIYLFFNLSMGFFSCFLDVKCSFYFTFFFFFNSNFQLFKSYLLTYVYLFNGF